jgi:metal-responsive CopG/Arc/MetJ family transcriptional regulator
MSEQVEQITVRLPIDLLSDIDAAAVHLDLSRAQFIRRACRELLIRLSERLIVVSDDTRIVEVTE